MARTSSSIHIDAPAHKVMGIIRDVENYPKWTAGITEVQVLERDLENRPVRAKFSLNGGPISDRVELQYTWQQNLVEWKLVSGNSITALDGSYRVVETENGCDVTYELSAEVGLAIPSFIKSAGEKTIISKALQGLKDFAS
jgi:ribosome-associated toxin RatA of RatAB toxin-antitoxin module